MSALFVVGLNLVELMVAGISFNVFTMFSSVYIGLATKDPHIKSLPSPLKMTLQSIIRNILT